MNLQIPKNSAKLERGSSSSAPPPRPFPPWTELPEHLTADILQRLPTDEIIDSAQRVCTTWWRVCKNPATWRAIDLDSRRPTVCSYDDVIRLSKSKLGFLFRRAVDLSQGQLLELKINVLDLENLLTYVADRSPQLRCLTVMCRDYNYINSNELILGLEKLPQLEELHLSMTSMLTSNDFEAIGIACPMLKSFSYHNCTLCSLKERILLGNVAAIRKTMAAIRKTMPNLRHLRLCEPRMRHMGHKGLETILDDCPHLKSVDKGLETILDDCPHLKSVDLRLCYALEKAYYSGIDFCSEQRKDLWLHTDSISFMDWIMQWKDSFNSDSEYIDDVNFNGPCKDCDDIFFISVF